MQRLTTEEYWDSLYDTAKAKIPEPKRFRFLRTVCYSERILWTNLFKKYLPKDKNLKALEVGSAPGDRLIKLHQLFGYTPYGVEYAKNGVDLNRKKFALYNIDPNNVIQADFFSDDFQQKYKAYFDIVISRGFLEHFSNPKEVIQKHTNLLKPQGTLIIMIPNFRGFNKFLQSLFCKEIITMHNLSIMKKQEFSELFEGVDLQTLYCNYLGTFNFGLFKNRKKICDYLQWLLNIIFYRLFSNRGFENRFFSPYLIFIGRKHGHN